ncbi:MAG: hypothetical protein Q9168_003972 [Polycauliona sp. 1 TL-2023]
MHPLQRFAPKLHDVLLANIYASISSTLAPIIDQELMAVVEQERQESIARNDPNLWNKEVSSHRSVEGKINSLEAKIALDALSLGSMIRRTEAVERREDVRDKVVQDLKADNARLKADNARLSNDLKAWNKYWELQKAKLKNLTKQCSYYKAQCCRNEVEYPSAKIPEFDEAPTAGESRLKMQSTWARWRMRLPSLSFGFLSPIDGFDRGIWSFIAENAIHPG